MSFARNAHQRVASSGFKQHPRTLATSWNLQRDAHLRFRLPVNAASVYKRNSGRRSRFPNALEDWLGEPLRLRERAMMAMMENIMGKVEWQSKVFDEEICARC